MQTLITVEKQTHTCQKMHSPIIFHLPALPHTHTHTHMRMCTHSSATHRSTAKHRQVCSPRVFLPVNDGPILKAAAACPTAPSGAENQDNFIVIISLLLSPSLSLVEEGVEGMKTERMCVSRLAGCSGPSPSVLLLVMFSFVLLWRLWWIPGFYALTRITVTSDLCSSPAPYRSRNHVPVNQIRVFETGAVKSRGTAWIIIFFATTTLTVGAGPRAREVEFYSK